MSEESENFWQRKKENSPGNNNNCVDPFHAAVKTTTIILTTYNIVLSMRLRTIALCVAMPHCQGYIVTLTIADYIL